MQYVFLVLLRAVLGFYTNMKQILSKYETNWKEIWFQFYYEQCWASKQNMQKYMKQIWNQFKQICFSTTASSVGLLSTAGQDESSTNLSLKKELTG